MRPPDVDLPPHEVKCLPQKHCSQATTCARWLIRLTPSRPVADKTAEMFFAQGACSGYLRATDHRRRTVAPAPTVHETPQGLR